MYTGFWEGNLRARDNLEDLAVVGRIILRWIFRKRHGGIDRIDPALDRDRCKHGNEPSGSIKYGEFLD